MAGAHADALGSMRRISLKAGRQDEFFLDLGAQAFANELTRLRIEHSLELFDGTHSSTARRYPRARTRPQRVIARRPAERGAFHVCDSVLLRWPDS